MAHYDVKNNIHNKRSVTNIGKPQFLTIRLAEVRMFDDALILRERQGDKEFLFNADGKANYYNICEEKCDIIYSS